MVPLEQTACQLERCYSWACCQAYPGPALCIDPFLLSAAERIAWSIGNVFMPLRLLGFTQQSSQTMTL